MMKIKNKHISYVPNSFRPLTLISISKNTTYHSRGAKIQSVFSASMSGRGKIFAYKQDASVASAR